MHMKQMNRTNPVIMDYYDWKVIEMIMDKYGIPEFEAIDRFLSLQTHEWLEDRERGMYYFNEMAIFEMWEVEMITGDVRNAPCLREDWKNLSTKAVYEKWKESGHLRDIYDRYWIYHQEALENAFHDIDHLMETGSFLY